MHLRRSASILLGALALSTAVYVVVRPLDRSKIFASRAALAPAQPTILPANANSPKNENEDLLLQIHRVFDQIEHRELTPDQLADFRQELLRQDPQKVIAALRAFLATGEDLPTGWAFELGEGGVLDQPPTLRLFLLDLLGRISRESQTADAADASRNILGSATSPNADEWAIAMRNVAWIEHDAKPYLAGKFREMISVAPWRTEPSAGMLESFDVAVYTGDLGLTPLLEFVLQGGQAELEQAAGVALDRLAESQPLAVMQRLNANPRAFANRPFLRADWFAKANLGDPAQRAAYETYLDRADVSTDEKTKSLDSMVTPSQFISDNLLTSNPAPISAAEDDARADAIASVFADWQKRSRFPTLASSLNDAIERLRK